MTLVKQFWYCFLLW